MTGEKTSSYQFSKVNSRQERKNSCHVMREEWNRNESKNIIIWQQCENIKYKHADNEKKSQTNLFIALINVVGRSCVAHYSHHKRERDEQQMKKKHTNQLIFARSPMRYFCIFPELKHILCNKLAAGTFYVGFFSLLSMCSKTFLCATLFVLARK